jgi:hypothetical protein
LVNTLQTVQLSHIDEDGAVRGIWVVKSKVKSHKVDLSVSKQSQIS